MRAAASSMASGNPSSVVTIAPARPGVEPELLLDAGAGAIGSPSVSFDGESIYVSMARADDPLYHIYRVPAGGGPPRQLTDGPFHDIDPAELPDGRIVFTSTRVGTFEEYHNPPSRALFVMNADGSDVHPLTHTIIFDNEPEVMADGRILFIRSDNFFDRGKVETLLHAIHTDGTEGYTEFGLDDRVPNTAAGFAPVSSAAAPPPCPTVGWRLCPGPAITVGRPRFHAAGHLRHFRFEAGDVSALPDGRLLCTVASPGSGRTHRRTWYTRTIASTSATEGSMSSTRASMPPTFTVCPSNRPVTALHSPGVPGTAPSATANYLLLSRWGGERGDRVPEPLAFLFCQDARFTKNTSRPAGRMCGRFE